MKAEIAKATAERQRALLPLAGEFWRHGADVVFVLDSDGERMKWATSDGEIVSATIEAFSSVDAERLDAGEGESSTFEDHAWVIASSTGVDPDIRVSVLDRTVKRAPDDEAREVVMRWILALSLGREPQR